MIRRNWLPALFLAVVVMGVFAVSSYPGSPTQAAPAQSGPFWRLQDDTHTFTFKGVCNLGSESEVVNELLTDPDGNRIVRPRPGRTLFQGIELTRDLCADLQLSEWRAQAEVSDMAHARRTMTLSLCGSDGTVVAKWELLNSWPTKLVVNSDDDGTPGTTKSVGAVEVLTLVCEKVQRVQ